MRTEWKQVDPENWMVSLSGRILADAGMTEVVEIKVTKGRITLCAVPNSLCESAGTDVARLEGQASSR